MSFEVYLGKRFAGLILVTGVLGAAYFVGLVEKFSTLATTLGLLYTAYTAGQSYTDGKEK